MSGHVDVLAAYDRRCAAQRRSIRIAISREWAPEEIERRQKELAQLNAEAGAVLELMEASRDLWRASLGGEPEPKERERVRAALARLSGAPQ